MLLGLVASLEVIAPDSIPERRQGMAGPFRVSFACERS